MAQDKDYKKLINSGRWRKLRQRQMSRQPLCESCKQKGQVTPGQVVHHIKPIEEGVTYKEKKRLAFNPANLQTLCNRCHSHLHWVMGRATKEQNKERKQEEVKKFIETFFKGA